MSLRKLQIKENEIKEAVLDVLAYFAIMGLRLDFDTLYSYLPIKASHLAVKKQLRNLIARGRVKNVNNKYGLARHKYPRQKAMQDNQQLLIKKAQRWSKFFRLIPSIKAIAIVNSVAYGNVHKQSDIDLFIITSPNRIFVTKGFLMYFLKTLRQLEDAQNSAARFSLGMFLTTKGVKMDKDIMRTNHPDLVYRMITCKPVYGDAVWYSILKNDAFLQARLPNYVWPKMPVRIYGSGFKYLDRLDDIAYRKHLKHTASQAKTHHPDAFIRVRPDIINLHHKDATTKIAEKWTKIRAEA